MEPYRDDENFRRNPNLGERRRKHGHRNLGNAPIGDGPPVGHRPDEQSRDRWERRRSAHHQGRSEIFFEFHPHADARHLLSGVRRPERTFGNSLRRRGGFEFVSQILRSGQFRWSRRLSFVGFQCGFRFRNRRLHDRILREELLVEISDGRRHAPGGFERRVPVSRARRER